MMGIGDYYEKPDATVAKDHDAAKQWMTVRAGGAVYWLHRDHLGSVPLATDASGNRVGEPRYTVWGGALEYGRPTDRQYTGQRWDEALGLYDDNVRYYDPALGRFIQPDTIIPDLANPQSLNRYAYVYNNPLRYTDPGGHCPWCIVIRVVLLKVVDYGWTAYDAWQAGRVLADPNASPQAKQEAAATLAMIAASEAAEPDEVLPISLPLDDLARKGLLKLGREAGEELVEEGVERAGKEAVENPPKHVHHFATNKSSKWTDRMAEIARKYGLDLDDAWNKDLIPHRGRHPDAYHEWVLRKMRRIDEIAQGNREVFLELFEKEVKQVVREHPEMLRKWYWEGQR